MQIHHSEAVQLLAQPGHKRVNVRELDGSEREVSPDQAIRLLLHGWYQPVARKKRVRLLMAAEPIVRYQPRVDCWANTNRGCLEPYSYQSLKKLGIGSALDRPEKMATFA